MPIVSIQLRRRVSFMEVVVPNFSQKSHNLMLPYSPEVT